MAIKPYLQLVRLPNVFTAAADSLAGWLLVQGTFRDPSHWVPLVLASACTYAGGIVLNDVFDYDVDLVERPQRPLPSGRVGRRFATVLGVALLAIGLALAVGSRTTYGWAVESALIMCVLAYDGGLKRSLLGPEVMGSCRGLNLVLGMSHAAVLGGPAAWLAAVSYGVFVSGITWISRSEVEIGSGNTIAAGLAFQNVAFFGLIVACAQTEFFPNPEPRSRLAFQNVAFFGLIVACAQTEFFPNPEPRSLVRVALGCMALAGIGFVVQSRTISALRTPTPELVQRAVKFSIMSLVWLHVGLVLGVRGFVPALVVALFWIPAVYLGRWIYST